MTSLCCPGVSYATASDPPGGSAPSTRLFCDYLGASPLEVSTNAPIYSSVFGRQTPISCLFSSR